MQNSATRKDLGAWYTPSELCRFLAKQTLRGFRAGMDHRPLTVCDPTMGEGAFLQAVAELAPDDQLHGVDLDPRAVAQGRLRLPEARLKHGNALVSPLTPADRTGLVPTRALLQGLIRERLEPLLGVCTDAFHPFCWELEFPEVFCDERGELNPDGGFDVVIGNPPWNNLRPDDREFFARHDATFRACRTRHERDRRARRLLRSRAIRAEYERYRAEFACWNALTRSGQFYQHQGGPAEGFRAYKIEHNLYKLALERAWELTRPGGRIGMIVPAGFLGDLGATQLRRLYFDGAACLGLWCFREDAAVFDAAQAFVVMVFEKGGRLRRFGLSAGLRDVASARDSLDAKPGVKLDLRLIRRTAPITYAVPELGGNEDLAILAKFYRHPPLGEVRPEDEWSARPARDLHTRDDRDLLVGKRGPDVLPALKGADIEAFRIRQPTRQWVRAEDYLTRGRDFNSMRVAWRAIANVHLDRRLQAALIPPRQALLNSLNYFIPTQPEPIKYYLLALLNSLVMEWRVRQLAKNNNINQYVIASLPAPRLRLKDARCRAIVALSRALVKAGAGTSAPLPGETRARLEALVARLYDLTPEEMACVLNRFPRIEPAFKQRVVEWMIDA
jgi:Alw26I/Eco31I/Esp3I family type II restriction m6 adenine DNA methyltransferase